VASVRYWTHDEATAALPRVRAQVQRIRELITRARQRSARVSGNGHAPSSNGQDSGAGSVPERSAGSVPERSAGSVPERGAGEGDTELRTLVGELQRDGIVLRDPERGLIDFPAQAPSGREYLLCWLDGEDAIEWWHWPDAGFAGRTPLTDPPE
jgi:hypothetical protein